MASSVSYDFQENTCWTHDDETHKEEIANGTICQSERCFVCGKKLEWLKNPKTLNQKYLRSFRKLDDPPDDGLNFATRFPLILADRKCFCSATCFSVEYGEFEGDDLLIDRRGVVVDSETHEPVKRTGTIPDDDPRDMKDPNYDPDDFIYAIKSREVREHIISMRQLLESFPR